MMRKIGWIEARTGCGNVTGKSNRTSHLLSCRDSLLVAATLGLWWFDLSFYLRVVDVDRRSSLLLGTLFSLLWWCRGRRIIGLVGSPTSLFGHRSCILRDGLLLDGLFGSRTLLLRG
jgi:hypothetical protein